MEIRLAAVLLGLSLAGLGACKSGPDPKQSLTDCPDVRTIVVYQDTIEPQQSCVTSQGALIIKNASSVEVNYKIEAMSLLNGGVTPFANGSVNDQTDSSSMKLTEAGTYKITIEWLDPPSTREDTRTGTVEVSTGAGKQNEEHR